MKSLLVLIVGLALGAGAMWFYFNHRDDPILRQWSAPAATNGSPGGSVTERLQQLQLRSGDLQDELARTGAIVRRAAQDASRAVGDATPDARLQPPSPYLADARLSALRISVNARKAGSRWRVRWPISKTLVRHVTGHGYARGAGSGFRCARP